MNCNTEATRARRIDPWTSRAAARAAAAFAGTHRAAILAALREHGPLSAEGIADITGIEAYAVRKRLPELQRAFLAVPTDRVEPTRSGRMQRVWVAVDEWVAGGGK